MRCNPASRRTRPSPRPRPRRTSASACPGSSRRSHEADRGTRVSLTRKTAAELAELMAAGDTSAVEVATAHLDRIAAVDGSVRAFLHVDRDAVLAQARAIDERRAAGERLGPLAGVPIAHKDVVCPNDMPTTCGSKILEGWRPPYDATVTARLRAAGLVILGKTNMDEFAMGSSTENSAFGPSHNPWDLSRVPGGSSGGSSAAVAAYEAPLSTGTDTGGGLPPPAAAPRRGDVAGLRIGVVKELSGEGYQPGVLARYTEAVGLLESLGAKVAEISCPHFSYALPAYYLIAPSECSSNLARFDAMRYGLRVGDDGTRSAEEVMALTRAAGFGAEVKRRIMLGTYALSSGYYDAYYGKAQQVRTLINRDFDAAFEQVDVLVSPTTPTTAFAIGERVDDPMAMYLADLCTIPSDLAGNAAISVPCGLADEDNLPVGLQIMAPVLADDRLYRVGAAVETALQDRWGGPLLADAPELAR